MHKLKFVLLAGLFSLQPGLVAASSALEQRVERLERVTNNPVILQQAQKIEQQNQEIQQLQDELDRLSHRFGQLEAKLKQQNIETDERLSLLEEKSKQPVAVPAPVVADTKSTTPAAEKAAEKPVQQDPKTSYEQAFALLKDNKFDAAIAAFQNFVKAHPNHSLTANGYYWLGESFSMKQNDADAFAAFDKVIKDFAESNKYNDSLLRAGDSLANLNRTAEAKKNYQKLLEIAPSTSAGKSAKRRLEGLK